MLMYYLQVCITRSYLQTICFGAKRKIYHPFHVNTYARVFARVPNTSGANTIPWSLASDKRTVGNSSRNWERNIFGPNSVW